VGGETVPENMGCDVFCHTRPAGSSFDFPANAAGVEMMAADLSGSRVSGTFRGGKNVLPNPFSGSIGVFPRQASVKPDGSITLRQCLLVSDFNRLQVALKVRPDSIRQDRNTVFRTLATSD